MLGETLMISVVIPFYNTERKLMDRCINSVLSQTYHSFECIIVDDGSSKQYASYLSEYENRDSRIKIVHKENTGLGSTRNFGVNIANGKYILFIDSDDYICPYTIEQGLDVAVTTNADMILGGLQHITIDETPSYIKERQIKAVIESKEDKISFINHLSVALQDKYTLEQGLVGLSACGKIIKRELAQKVPFDENKYWDEDNIWSITITHECKKIVIIDALWYYYVMNPNSMIRGYAGDRTAEFQSRAKQEYYLFHELWPECIQGAYHHVWGGMLTYCRTDTFHPDNPNSKRDRYICFKKAIDFDEFNDSVHNIDFSSESRLKYRIVKKTINRLLLLPNKRPAYYLLCACNKKIVF